MDTVHGYSSTWGTVLTRLPGLLDVIVVLIN